MGLLNKIYWKLNKMCNQYFVLGYIKWVIENIKILTYGNYYVLICTPEHGNLGDHAIALAEYQFLKKCNKNKKVLEIPARYVQKINTFKLWIGKRDILVHGGGFIGTLWINEEYNLRNLVKSFPDNKIIIFPQTITFSHDMYGKRELSISRDIYNRHSDLTICTRENKSYEFALKYFNKAKIIKIPDMVLQMEISSDNCNERTGVLMCMRSDHEKKISETEYEEIRSKCEKIFNGNMRNTDTNDAVYVQMKNRLSVVNRKLWEFRCAEIAITDRLHGMVFAALTGTPCIALGNSNGKIKGTYEWIKNYSYIQYLDSIDQFDDAVNDVLNANEKEYNYKLLEEDYMPLVAMLRD